MTNSTQREDEDDALAVKQGSCLAEAVMILVLGVLTFLIGIAWLIAEAVLQTYDYECKEAGKRGAYRRTADRYGISEDTVERYVHRREEREAAKEAEAAAGLAYEPPPFADELAAPTPQILLHLTDAPAPIPARAQFDEREAMREVMSICTDQDALNGACAGDVREHSPQDETPQSRSVELQEQPQIPAGPPHITPESDPAPDRPQSPPSPGHARPDLDDPGSEMPNLPTEAFPDPSPNQPAPVIQPPAPPPQLPSLPPDPDPDNWPISPEDPPQPSQRADFPRPPSPEPQPHPIPEPTPVPEPIPIPVPGPHGVRFRITSPTVAAYLERRHQVATVAPVRHPGMLPMMWQSEYRGVWLGVLIFLGLMVLVWLG